MKKLFLSFLLLGSSLISNVFASEPHQVENLHVSIPSKEYRSSRFIDSSEDKGRTYITGKSSSYNKNGEANAGKLLWPSAEYAIKTKVAGAKYKVIVHLRLNKEASKRNNNQIVLKMDELKESVIDIKDRSGKQTVSSVFDVKFLRGKNHVLRLSFPSEGTEVEKIEIRLAL